MRPAQGAGCQRIQEGHRAAPAPPVRPAITHQSIADLNKVRVIPTRTKKGDSEHGITPTPSVAETIAAAAAAEPSSSPFTAVEPIDETPAAPVAASEKPSETPESPSVVPTIAAEATNPSAAPKPTTAPPELGRVRELRDLNRGRSAETRGPQGPKPNGGAPPSPPMARRAFDPVFGRIRAPERRWPSRSRLRVFARNCFTVAMQPSPKRMSSSRK